MRANFRWTDRGRQTNTCCDVCGVDIGSLQLVRMVDTIASILLYHITYSTSRILYSSCLYVWCLIYFLITSTTVVCSAQSISYCTWHKNWYNYFNNIKSLSWKFSRNEYYTSCVVFINLVCLIGWSIDRLLFSERTKKDGVLTFIFIE